MLRVGFACCEPGANPFDRYTFDQRTFGRCTCGDSIPLYYPSYTSWDDCLFHFAASDESAGCKSLENCPSPEPFRRQNPDSNNSAQCLPTESRSKRRMNIGKPPRNNTTSVQTQFQ